MAWEGKRERYMAWEGCRGRVIWRGRDIEGKVWGIKVGDMARKR
jgi:hypothetical protein